MDLNPEKRDQSELLLSLIGPMRVQVNARPVELQSRKARALLAYLALRRGVAVPRDTLCALLWGDRGEEQARASLRQTLSVIRKDLRAAAGLIEGRGDHVSLSSHDTWCDVDHLMTFAHTRETNYYSGKPALRRQFDIQVQLCSFSISLCASIM
jgi:DNA-binding SARP family transcriptional activator